MTNSLVAMMMAECYNYETNEKLPRQRSTSAWWVLWRYLPLLVMPFVMKHPLLMPTVADLALTSLAGLFFGNAVYRVVFNARIDKSNGYLGERVTDKVYRGVGYFLGLKDPGEFAYCVEFLVTFTLYGILAGRALC